MVRAASASGATGRGKRAMINLDTVSRYFEPEEEVTLAALKEKRLISRHITHLKILARGTLDKPLKVRAHSFSSAAVKMILLTGGTVLWEEEGRE